MTIVIFAITRSLVAAQRNAEANVAAAPVASDGADRNGLPRTTAVPRTNAQDLVERIDIRYSLAASPRSECQIQSTTGTYDWVAVL